MVMSRGEIIQVIFQQRFELEEKLHAIGGGRVAPRGKCGMRGLYRRIYFCSGAGRRFSKWLAGGRVGKFNAGGVGRGDPLAADQVVNCGGSNGCHGNSM